MSIEIIVMQIADRRRFFEEEISASALNWSEVKVSCAYFPPSSFSQEKREAALLLYVTAEAPTEEASTQFFLLLLYNHKFSWLQWMTTCPPKPSNFHLKEAREERKKKWK